MQEYSQLESETLDKEQLLNKINKYEHDIIKIKDKNISLQQNIKILEEQYNAEKLRTAEYELEKNHLNTQNLAKEEELNRLKESNKTQQLELEYFEKILYSHAQTQLEKDEIVENQKRHYREIYQKYVDLDIQYENTQKENLLLKNEKGLLEQRIASSQKQCEVIQEIYKHRLQEFQEQFDSMNTTITILQRQVDENKHFKEFMQMQIQLNQGIEADIEERANEYRNMCVEGPSNSILKQTNISDRMIAENESEQINNLLEENIQLSQQILDYEMKIAPKILEKEREVKVLKEQLKELQKQNEEIAKENSINLKELREIKEKQQAIKENEELQSLPVSQFTEKDIQQLQKAYVEEKTIRIKHQQALKEIQDEMKRKNPILRKQNEKWLKLNQEFLRFEQDYGQLQTDLISKEKNLEDLKDELEKSLNDGVQLQSQISFLKEEIQRLATQIQHLLKVNLKLKQSISTKLGKNTLEEIISAIKQEKNQQLEFSEIDQLYSTNYQSLYSDIQELVEMNMQLCKKLRDRS